MSAEHSLWTLYRNGQTLQARAQATPSGLELRLFLDQVCIWSTVVRPDEDLRAVVGERRRAFEGQGWWASN